MNIKIWMLIIFFFYGTCCGYVNVGLNKPAYQQNPYVQDDERVDASNAVDGRKSNLWWTNGQCTVSASKETATWWLNLTSIHSIHHITIYYMTENRRWGPSNYLTRSFLGFSLYVSNTTDKTQGTMCFKDTNFTSSTIPAVFTIDCPMHGQYVIYYNERLRNITYPGDYSEYAENDLCEVEVYGCPFTGYYGENCSIPCPDVNCHYCHIETGTCQGCKSGFQGHQCEFECSNGYFGKGCSGKCNATCIGCNNINGFCDSKCFPGWKGDYCGEVCLDGFFGQGCVKKCNDTCNGCNRTNGLCESGCLPGWTGDYCHDECGSGLFGADCNETCGHCRDKNHCSHINGSCLTGCDAGYHGEYCKTHCKKGTYGFDCNETCGRCRHDSTCLRTNGSCLTGCDAGYTGEMCQMHCQRGSYGIDCGEQCGHCLDVKQCFHVNGTCLTGCEAGYQGTLCKATCNKGSYGLDCGKDCGHCYGNNDCHHVNGTCFNGCMAGFHGNMCITSCEKSFYGINCTQNCDNECINQDCHHENGKCITNGQSDQLSNVFVLFGSLLLVVLILMIIYKRAQRKTLGELAITIKDDNTTDTSNRHYNHHTVRSCSPVYQNIDVEGIRNLQNSFDMTNAQGINSNKANSRLASRDENNDVDEQSHVDVVIEGAEEKGIFDIDITKLEEVIDENMRNDDWGFKKEYATLINEEQYPCEIGKLPENIPKNRFKAIFPYDHSRVILHVLEQCSDYINANYIDGIGQKKVYIATQGPKQNTVSDFWLMVWQENVSQIIMLTNLMEGTKKKCVQYWPDFKADRNCDNFRITSTDEICYAHYVIRKLKITNKKQNESRIVTQYHYIAWPDHGTPDPLCLLLFLNNVTRTKNIDKECPLLVHCSAGIGRTGTYIAIDALYKESQRNYKINVVEYVKEMRKSRINMVQTFEQYKVVYFTLNEIFKVPTSLQNKTEFLQKRQAATKDNLANEYSLEKEFQRLVAVQPQYTEKDYMIAADIKDTSSSIFPLDKYMLFLTSDVQKRGTYINAVAVPSFTRRGKFIITHHQNSTNAVDFLRLITDYESDVVVSMDPLSSYESVSQWVPTAEIKANTLGPFIIQLQHEQTSKAKCRNIKICKEGIEDNGCLVNLVEPLFNHTLNKFQTASQVIDLVSFVQNFETEKPITVVSRDGSTMCGVFCAVYNLIQQLTMDEEIDVFSVVRLLQTRRPELCHSLEEYELIHDAMFRFIESQTDEHIYYNQ